jgi:DnaJ-class molecular chaperone
MKTDNTKECPSCLGIGETMKNDRKVETCTICVGEGSVHPDIAKEFLKCLQVFGEEEYE